MKYPLQKLTGDSVPPLLQEIPDKPHSLYMRGQFAPASNKFLAVVGSRRMSSYGKGACEKIILGLRGHPISVVSGLALGIDGCAHRAALNAGLHTIAVPGSGLNDDALYPRSHVRLAYDILDAGGALISEEEPDFRARPESFPKRNRIMAGMSHAVLVIEATIKSGTLITSKLATEYNRDVLTVPGSIFSVSTEGPHMLLKLGAMPVCDASDVLEALQLESALSAENLSLSPDEEQVIELLASPREQDDIIRNLGLPIAKANALLLGMELKKLISVTLGVVRKNI